MFGPQCGPTTTTSQVLASRRTSATSQSVCGHSAHVVQPIGLINGAPISYDLGDLLDDYAIDPELRNDLGLLGLFRPREQLELVPLRLEYTGTRLATGDDHARLVDRLLAAAGRDGVDLRVEGNRLVLDLAREPA
jgi:Bacterial capsule synthesis protein PGA_cap